MSGTRKMGKFELEAFAESGDPKLVGERDVRAGKGTAGEAGTEHESADLPSRAFEPVGDPEADLPDLSFAPRSGNRELANLPERPFVPRALAGADPHVEGRHDDASRRERAPASGQRAPDATARAATPEDVHAATPFVRAPANVDDGVSPVGLDGSLTPSGGWIAGEWVPPQAADDAASAGPPRADALQTALTRKFVSLAETVTDELRDVAIGRASYVVELTQPEGMSTGGGKRALQHLRLCPRREGYSVLVVGTVNPVERRADLRDYDHVAALHQVRFRTAIDIERNDWDRFLRQAEEVLNRAGIQSMRTAPPRELLDERRRSVPRVSQRGLAVFVVVLVLAALVLWRVVATLHRS